MPLPFQMNILTFITKERCICRYVLELGMCDNHTSNIVFALLKHLLSGNRETLHKFVALNGIIRML